MYHRPHQCCRTLAEVSWPSGQHLQQHADRRSQQRERCRQQDQELPDRRLRRCPWRGPPLQGAAPPSPQWQKLHSFWFIWLMLTVSCAHNLRRLMLFPGLWLEMTTTVRAPAENTLPWSPGTWEEEPSLSRALPEFMVQHHFVTTSHALFKSLFLALSPPPLVCRNQPKEAGSAATDLQQPIRLWQDPPRWQNLHQRTQNFHSRESKWTPSKTANECYIEWHCLHLVLFSLFRQFWSIVTAARRL